MLVHSGQSLTYFSYFPSFALHTVLLRSGQQYIESAREMADSARQAAMLQSTVHPPPKPLDDATNPYYKIVSQTDATLQSIELQPSQQPWAAPTPSKEAIERSLSNPLLQSSAAVEARKAAHTARTSPTKSTLDPVLSVKPGSGAFTAKTATSSVRRPATAGGKGRVKAVVPSPPPAESVEPVEGETFTANQIRKLEAEVEHLKTTVDVLLTAKSGARATSVALRGVRGTGQGSLVRPSGLRTTAGTLTSPSRVMGPEERAAVEIAVHESHRDLLASTMADNKEHSRELLALEKEIKMLRQPAVHAEMTRSAYGGVDPAAGLRSTTPTPKPVVLPAPLQETPPRGGRRSSSAGGGARRGSQGSVLQYMGGGASASPARRASLDAGRRQASPAGVVRSTPARPSVAGASESKEGGGVREQNAATRDKRYSVLKASASGKAVQYSESKEGKEDDSRGMGGYASYSYATTTSTSSPAARPRTAAGARSGPAATRSSTRPASAGPTLQAPAFSDRKLTKAELEAQYAGLPGLHKEVAETTKTEAFTFTQKERISIREAKFMAYMEAKRQEEEEALGFQFKAQPIAPATRDLDLYRRIMEKLQKRREDLHAKRAAAVAATVKPFEVVNKHCDEHAARQAANRARFLLEEQRELEEGRKFKANPVPNLNDPDGMFTALLKRESERSSRVAAMAREFYSTASLPPRMALAVEVERRKKAEREARKREEESRDKKENAFHSNPLPDFGKLHSEFEETLVSAKVTAVSKMGGLTVPKAFGFDEPQRVHADAVRKEKWIREADLQTSSSFALRRVSTAYAEGQPVVPGSAGAALRPGTAGGRLGGTGSLHRGSSTQRPHSASGGRGGQTISEKLAVNNAPPASMTRSVQLKILSAQQKLREFQEKELRKQQEDEAYERTMKEATQRMAPLFQAMERERVPIPMAWQMDKVASSVSDARQKFERETAARERENRQRVAAAQQNRPLVMMQYALQQKSEEARARALETVARAAASVRRPHTAAGHGAAQQGDNTWRSVVENGVEGTQIFTQEEKDIMAAAASAE